MRNQKFESPFLSRRVFTCLFGAAAVQLLSGCAGRKVTSETSSAMHTPPTSQRVHVKKFVSKMEHDGDFYAEARKIYAERIDDGYVIPPVNLDEIPPRFFRQIVDDPTGEAKGTLVVDTQEYHLYYVLGGGRAVRYGVGLGRQGFEWSGNGKIAAKRTWPVWTPPQSMIERQPELAKYRTGMPPGVDNPLGSRALYIFEGGKDTLYRVHGTYEAWSIGHPVSSGCVRMLNQDVIDLYGRVKVGSSIVVKA